MLCSRFGIDETREVPRVLQEVSRVLKRDGRFISVSKTDPTEVFRYLIGNHKFSQAEFYDMVQRARLYAGKNAFLNSAAENEFEVIDIKTYKSGDKKGETLYILKKT